ncbi:hypothetical protein VNO80_20226 [Phaseolus coccineus]|uniref:PGG domain-containing protein n=1 Tax=Phaseolus coccineus TaxID=3886 RepID=A0AAN9MHM1_PHACN
MSNSPTPTSQLSNHATASNANYNAPDDFFLQDTNANLFYEFCVPLYKYALKGNWTAAQPILENNDVRLQHAAITSGWSTLLHVAAGSNHSSFVEELLRMLEVQHLSLQDSMGNTAFCFAVASGNMRIANLLIEKYSSLPYLPPLQTIRGGGGYIPIQFAVMQGRCEMTWFLYNQIRREEFGDRDKSSLFFSCIKTGNHRLALEMAREWEDLAWARDQNNDTALHLLALDEVHLHSCSHCPEITDPITINPASVGNFGFLSELISAYPNLIWEVDNKNHSIIHTAVTSRHASIFNLIHEIESQKDLIVTYFVDPSNPSSSQSNIRKSTLLHLAAELAPPKQLELVSGAALQMCLEITWFEEVKKIMPPSYIIMKNSDGLTAQELFTKEHEGLRKEGEDWIKRTAEFCMLISTVITAAVFTSAINIPGGISDETKKPNYLDKTAFLVFAISDAVAFISSATAIWIFLSIIISRYAQYDFYRSLPLKLIFGLIALFISIVCMMVAFSSSFFITYTYGLKMVPYLVSIVAMLPLFLYIGLQYPLWLDILYSTFYWRKLFRPSKCMIYD